MAKPSHKQGVSPETKQEAMQTARGIQRRDQTKEQTKLVTQGIQKGIEQYKKQQSAKARELDRQRNKTARQQPEQGQTAPRLEVVRYRQHWLPWSLLALTWLGIALYFIGQYVPSKTFS